MNSPVQDHVMSYFKPTTKANTARAYSKLLRSLWKNALGKNDEELLAWNWEKCPWTKVYRQNLIDWVEQSDLKNTTKRNYINAIHVTFADDEEHRKHTLEHISRLSDSINHSEGRQRRDTREQKHGMSYVDLVALEKYLFRNMESLKDHFEWLALACYTKQPPLRLQWGDMMITADTAKAQLYNEQKLNYVLAGTPHMIIINDDKVVHSQGVGVIEMRPELESALKHSFQIWPRGNSRIFPVLYRDLAKVLRNIKGQDGKPVHQGVQLLRSSYITHFYDKPGVDHNAKVDLAKDMRHSWQMAEVNYRKIVE